MMLGTAAYSMALTRRSVSAVVGDTTSNTALGATMSSLSSGWLHTTLTSGYRTRAVVITFSSGPCTSQGGLT